MSQNTTLNIFKEAFIYGLSLGNIKCVNWSIKYLKYKIYFVEQSVIGKVKVTFGYNYQYTDWYKNGLKHNEDGPAQLGGGSYYYINDKQLTKQQFAQWQQDNI